ncbi:LysR substrate-binding domain-containing protein [Streptomyces sp. NPDC048527]|uniref:LysR family transcriptional regulator substrate-binding protein n=1 Tax=Streptomyces sp. NPDC048527 TaxID=3365568 RepID=UPI00372107AB
MTAWLLVPILRRWRARRPDVQLDLMEFTSSDKMVEILMGGEADLVVGSEPTGTTAHLEVLGDEEMVVMASAGHRFADQPSVTVGDLIDEPFVSLHTGQRKRRLGRSVRRLPPGLPHPRAAHPKPSYRGLAGRRGHGRLHRPHLRPGSPARRDRATPGTPRASCRRRHHGDAVRCAGRPIPSRSAAARSAGRQYRRLAGFRTPPRGAKGSKGTNVA